jgi:ketosteroid isomerase-like protein
MAASYEPDAVFDDPVFGFLSGTDAGWMWRMLLAKTNLTVEHTLRLSEDGGVVDWVARYTYATADEKAAGKPGRPVVNRVRSTITLRDGKIVRQHDFFSFPRWARQALPLTAVQRLLSYTPLVALIRKAVYKGASDALRVFKEKNNG